MSSGQGRRDCRRAPPRRQVHACHWPAPAHPQGRSRLVAQGAPHRTWWRVWVITHTCTRCKRPRRCARPASAQSAAWAPCSVASV